MKIASNFNMQFSDDGNLALSFNINTRELFIILALSARMQLESKSVRYLKQDWRRSYSMDKINEKL